MCSLKMDLTQVLLSNKYLVDKNLFFLPLTRVFSRHIDIEACQPRDIFVPRILGLLAFIFQETQGVACLIH